MKLTCWEARELQLLLQRLLGWGRTKLAMTVYEENTGGCHLKHKFQKKKKSLKEDYEKNGDKRESQLLHIEIPWKISCSCSSDSLGSSFYCRAYFGVKDYSHLVGTCHLFCLWTCIDTIIMFKNLKPKLKTRSHTHTHTHTHQHIHPCALSALWLFIDDVNSWSHLEKCPSRREGVSVQRLASETITEFGTALGYILVKRNLSEGKPLQVFWDQYPRVSQLIPFLLNYLLWKIKRRLSSLSLMPFGFLSLSLPFELIANNKGDSENDSDVFAAAAVLVSISATWQTPSVYLSSPKSVICWGVVSGVTPFFLSLMACLFNQSLLQFHVWEL